MSDSYSKWSDVKARRRAADRRTADEQARARGQPASAGPTSALGGTIDVVVRLGDRSSKVA